MASPRQATVKTQQTTHATHSFSEEERVSFALHINDVLSHEAALEDHLPIDPDTMGLFEGCADGMVLCHLINDAVPDTIDMRVVNKGKKLNIYQKTENNNLVVNSAKAIGCSVVNIGSQDIIEGRPHLVLGLIWQIIRIGLLSKITLTNHPELFRLLEPGEDISDLLKLPPDQILLRWVNYHLKNANHDRRMKNFGEDVKDSVIYTVLLNQLSPSLCDKAPLQQSDLNERAEGVLQNADKLDCRKFLKPRDIVNGNPKLNLAFVANLFNKHPGLEPLSEAELAALEEWLFASEGTREARAFCLWINSLGIEPFVRDLFEDLRDGLVLLRVMDKVRPGIVNWRSVNQKVPMNKFKKVENCNYAVVLGKQLKFSLVGIGGTDIVDGNKTLTLALVWQLMRLHVVSIIESLTPEDDDGQIKDDDIVKWANAKVASSGKDTKMSNFKDSSLKTSHFFLDLLEAIKPKTVDYSLITPGEEEDDAINNAKYAISVARKLGCTIFLLPEDIWEVKPKMILTFVASMWAASLAQ